MAEPWRDRVVFKGFCIMVAKNTVNKKLTRKQQLFVKHLVSNDGLITNRQAAEKAGYPASSAHTRAFELMNPNKCPHVVAEIKRYRDELDEQYGINFKRHLADLAKIKMAAMEAGHFSAATQAEYRRGQAGGLYVSKSEIRHGTIDQMSVEDVERELQRIREGFEKIIDITPDNVEEITASGEEPLEAIESKLVKIESGDRDNAA